MKIEVDQSKNMYLNSFSKIGLVFNKIEAGFEIKRVKNPRNRSGRLRTDKKLREHVV